MVDEQVVLFAEAAIREFLAQRPDSADTLEGIHRWWILWPGLPESPVISLIALERLEAAGLMERLLIGNTVLWRRAREASRPD
ncbi:hypothetical protein E6C76_14080 [Pseudothauera nasutitermitis]|uniref:Uncharacterized protein n=1 Tax=Pseudothauera nasutitermitis TaxID=2565930 RepID=A0A4V3WBL8_9RHOO|nr:hypothetical protein [Pseudothauera nasutitermitis]THF63713.1 hypothetical protein E6C76_14080 [Pseudothauera nasutitermitis]